MTKPKLVRQNTPIDIIKHGVTEWGSILKCVKCGQEARAEFEEIPGGVRIKLGRCDCVQGRRGK